MLSVDFAGGASRASTGRTEINSGDLLQTGNQNSRFLSTNLGLQTRLFSRLFVNASLLAIWQGYDLSQTVYPGSFGEYTAHHRLVSASDSHWLQAAAPVLRLRRGVAFFQ